MKVNNWKTICRLSFRSMRMSRKRNFIAVSAIVLTTLLFTSLFTIVLSINSSYEMYTFRRIGGCCHGTFKDVSEEQAAAISGHPKVNEAGERIVLGCMEKGEFARIPAEVSFMDENCTKWSFAEPEQGHFPEGAKEITMDDQALRLLGIVPEIGASVPLTYTFVDNKGISHEKTDTFTLAGC